MISAGIYTFLSVLGMLWGIVSSYPKTAFGKILYNSTLIMGSTYFIIAIAAAISSFILHTSQKTKIRPVKARFAQGLDSAVFRLY